MKKQRILVFQQKGSGREKIRGIQEYGAEHIRLDIFDIDDELPPLVDHTENLLPRSKPDCDLVLNYLTHPDLSYDLILLCRDWQLPVISSGKRSDSGWGHTPVTCCGLPETEGLGKYGELFGVPSFQVTAKNGLISSVKVVRGAPCGASWLAAEKLIGKPVEDAARIMGLQAQFFCHADPAGWDPLHGKSPVHFAGKIHAKGIETSLKDLG